MKRMRAALICALALAGFLGVVFGVREFLHLRGISVRTQLSATGVLVVYVNNPSCAGLAGSICHTGSNMCGQVNTGTVLCDGTCSATTVPPDSQCVIPPLPPDPTPPPSNGGSKGGGGGGGGAPVAQASTDASIPTKKVSGSCGNASDLNTDCRVNLVDFSILVYWYKRPLTGSGLAADLNHDGKVDLTDFSILVSHWTG